MNYLHRLARSARVFSHQLFHASQSVSSPQQCKIGIAFGGGFARGLVHVGVLKVLEEEGIPIGFVAGTSVGSVIAAAFASGVSAGELGEIARMVRFRDFARWSVSRYGICSNDRMRAFLSRVVRATEFEQLRIPLAVTATDFLTGEPVVFRSGPLCDAIRASCAYPGMFAPVRCGGRLLVDGMLGHAVPTTPVRDLGAGYVIAVCLSAHWLRLGKPRHLFDVIGQCFSIAQARMSVHWRKDADLVLEPNVEGFAYDAFERSAELIAVGEKSMRAALPGLRKALAASGLKAPREAAAEANPHPTAA